MNQEFLESSAKFSPCRKYRYSLTRVWDRAKPPIGFIMLNPSTADAFVLDPTVRRCVNYAKAWGGGSLWVANLFAWRSTFPAELNWCSDPVGEENDRDILLMAQNVETIICAWGVHGQKHQRDVFVRDLLRDADLHVLGLTKDGHPKHPLYLSKDLTPLPWPQR